MSEEYKMYLYSSERDRGMKGLRKGTYIGASIVISFVSGEPNLETSATEDVLAG